MVLLVATTLLLLLPSAPALAFDIAGWSVDWIATDTPVDAWEGQYFEGGFYGANLADAGRLVFITQGDGDLERYVVLYDGATGERRQLSEGAAGASDPQLLGDHVAWVGRDGPDSEIYLHTLSTGETVKVTDNLDTDSRPRLSGEYLVWSHGEYDKIELWAYEISTARTWRLTAKGYPANFRVEGRWLLEHRYGEGSSTLVLHDLASGEKREDPNLREARVHGVVGDKILASLAGRDGIGLYDPASSSDSVKDLSSIDKAKADGPGEFADISSSPYKNAIIELANAINPNTGDNIVGGYDDGTFRPNNPLWRAQFAKMIVNALELPVSESKTVKFSDMGTDDPNTLYPHDFVAVATEKNLIKGYTDGTFKPYTDIKRAHEMTMVVRAIEQFAPGVLKTPPSGWHSPMGDFAAHTRNADFFYYNNLQAGISTWNTDPWKAATRGETAQILVNLRNKVKETPTQTRELKKLNISLTELQGYGLPDFEVITGPVSTATQEKFNSFRPNMNVLYEEPTNDPNDMNAVLVKERVGYYLPDGLKLSGDGVTKYPTGEIISYRGRVLGFAEVNGENYIIAEKRNTHERWALGINNIDQNKLISTQFTTADLRKEDTANPNWIDIIDKQNSGQSVYQLLSEFISTGDTLHATHSRTTTMQDILDENGIRQGRNLTNFRQASFDSFVASFY